MMLSMEWRARPSISEIRAAIGQVHSFYSPDVLFEGNVARCSWETGMDLGTGVHEKSDAETESSSSGSDDADDNVQTQIFREKFPISEEDEDTKPQQVSRTCESPISQSESSSYTSDPISPITPSSFASSFDHHLVSRPRSPFSSFFTGIQCFLRLCSSSSYNPESKDRFDPRSGNATIDF